MNNKNIIYCPRNDDCMKRKKFNFPVSIDETQQNMSSVEGE